MSNNTKIPASLFLLLLFLVATSTHAQTPHFIAEVANPLTANRTDEIVSIAWSEVQQRLGTANADQLRVVDASTGLNVPMQVIDNDADGQPDELLFLADVWANGTCTYRVEASTPSESTTPRVHARHDEERDDLAWESDKMAFRTYGKGLWEASAYAPLVSSGIDVWLKRVPDLIVEPWYAKGHDAYHIDTGEGADFFSVGESLGAGGTALWQDGELVRAPNFSDYRIITTGPLRAIFELEYDAIGDEEVQETKRFIVDAGQYLFRQESTFQTDAESVTYAVGLVERSGTIASTNGNAPWAWLSLWGPVERNAGGHGNLGTAVLLHQDHLNEIRDLDRHYVALATAMPGASVVHYLGAGWTASGAFDTVEDWWAYLDAFSQRLGAPLQVTVKAE